MKVARLQALKHRFFSRATDFWTSLFILILGFYGVFDAPEHLAQDSALTATFILIIGVYYMVAAIVILFTIIIDPVKYPVIVHVGQEYAWLFIGCAAVSTMIMYIASLWYLGAPHAIGEFVIWTVIWIVLGALSFTHWHHMRRMVKGH